MRYEDIAGLNPKAIPLLEAEHVPPEDVELGTGGWPLGFPNEDDVIEAPDSWLMGDRDPQEVLSKLTPEQRAILEADEPDTASIVQEIVTARAAFTPSKPRQPRPKARATATAKPRRAKDQPTQRVVMKALSVKQPWASQIAQGKKKIEYRSWQTHYRGDLLICSSVRPPIAPAGYALAVVELFDCRWSDTDGCYHWRLRNVRPLKELFRVKGWVGLYNVEVPTDLFSAKAK